MVPCCVSGFLCISHDCYVRHPNQTNLQLHLLSLSHLLFGQYRKNFVLVFLICCSNWCMALQKYDDLFVWAVGTLKTAVLWWSELNSVYTIVQLAHDDDYRIPHGESTPQSKYRPVRHRYDVWVGSDHIRRSELSLSLCVVWMWLICLSFDFSRYLVHMTCIPSKLSGLVKPCLRVHAVDVETGQSSWLRCVHSA